MTFEDEIKPIHWHDMLSGMGTRKERLAVRSGIAVGAILFALLSVTMAVFVYAVFAAFSRKGVDGVLADPMILGLIAAGTVVGIVAIFYLVFDKRALQLLWGLRNGPAVEPGMLRPDINTGNVRVTLGDDAIELRMPHDLDRVKWSAFTELRETADTIMLMFNRKVGVVVPKAVLVRDGLLDEARAHISSRLPTEPAQ
ncbi:MAG: YcxB family protein [Pseudomonadota bacterium]